MLNANATLTPSRGSQRKSDATTESFHTPTEESTGNGSEDNGIWYSNVCICGFFTNVNGGIKCTW
jgi:hypothetical protein